MPLLLEEDRVRPLPKLYPVRQSFARPRLEDPAAAVRRALEDPDIAQRVRPGAKIAVAVGSRGIRNLFPIVQAAVAALQKRGAFPFLVSAMGSHGGGTEAGQREVLSGYGLTEEALGVPVVTAVESRRVGCLHDGTPVYFDKAALSADLIVPINRIKLHTDFSGALQSGLCKMLVIGLGNQVGCSAIHEEPPERFADVLEEAAALLLKRASIGFGIAILENAYDETAAIEAVPAETLIAREKELVGQAMGLMPRLLFDDLDVLIMRRMGKDISGAGFDPNIVGRSSVRSEYPLPIPKIRRMVLLDLTGRVARQRHRRRRLRRHHAGRCSESSTFSSMYANAVACKLHRRRQNPARRERRGGGRAGRAEGLPRHRPAQPAHCAHRRYTPFGKARSQRGAFAGGVPKPAAFMAAGAVKKGAFS